MKKNGIFWVFFTCLFFLHSAAFAQTLYEIVFSSGGVQYKGFLVFFNEEDAFMRIGYTYQKKYNVVNVDYQAKTGSEDDEEYYILIGRNPRFISSKDSEQTYNPDHFLWVWNRNEAAGLPYVTDDPNFKSESLILCDSYREIVASELTETYLKQFFRTNEKPYLALRKMMLAHSGSVAITENDIENNSGNNTSNTHSNTHNESQNYNQKAALHLIMVVNTEVADIGLSCSADQRMVESEFREISKALKIPFNKHIVNGESFTKAKVENTLQSLKVSGNDVLVFYYSGHGFRWSDQTDPYPMLDMRYSDYTKIGGNTSIALSELSKYLSGKGARLNLILSDCCNSDIGRNQMTNTTFMAGRSFQGAEVEKLSKLFLASRGTLIMTGSSPGEYSWCNVNGGFFTLSFIQALKEEIGYMREGTPTWEHIAQTAAKTTKNKAATGIGKSQIPFYQSRISK